jgi:hypothetical protein
MKKHKEVDNPYALAHYMKNKGYKSHKKEESVAEGFDPVAQDYSDWSQALYPDGDGAKAFDTVARYSNGDANTIRNILTYVRQNRHMLGREAGDRTGRTIKDAIIDIRKAYPQLYQAAQQPQGVAEGGAKDRQWSNKDMERLRVATRDFDDIMASDAYGRRINQDATKQRLKTKPIRIDNLKIENCQNQEKYLKIFLIVNKKFYINLKGF